MFKTSIALAGGPDPAKMRADLATRLRNGTLRAAEIVLGYLRLYSAKTILSARTGDLARAWGIGAVTSDRSSVSVSIRNRMPYARILELGGDIKPKTAKMLAVPLSGGPAVTARGVVRYTSPREVPGGLFVWPTKRMKKPSSAKKFLVQATKSGKLDFWYVLKDKTTIPPKGYATAALEASRARAEEEIRRALLS